MEDFLTSFNAVYQAAYERLELFHFSPKKHVARNLVIFKYKIERL